MTCAVEFECITKRLQLFGCAFYSAFLFTNQENTATRFKLRCHSMQQIIQQFFRLGYKNNRLIKLSFRHLCTKMHICLLWLELWQIIKSPWPESWIDRGIEVSEQVICRCINQ